MLMIIPATSGTIWPRQGNIKMLCAAADAGWCCAYKSYTCIFTADNINCFVQYCNAFIKLNTSLHWPYLHRQAELIKSDSKRFWKLVNKGKYWRDPSCCAWCQSGGSCCQIIRGPLCRIFWIGLLTWSSNFIVSWASFLTENCRSLCFLRGVQDTLS